MYRTLELSPPSSGALKMQPPAGRAKAATTRDPIDQPQVWRYLPLALLSTLTVIVLPAALAVGLIPRGSIGWMLASSAAAVVLSIVLATIGGALWKRQPRSRDIVFSELMLWCWLRRCWAESRLSHARELLDSVSERDPRVNVDLLIGMSRLLEARDPFIHGHSRRVARHAVRIAKALGLPATEVVKIRTAAMVHDVGKLYTPPRILNNPRKLTDAEFDVIKRHASDGAEMLAVVGDAELVAIVRHHHERIDGGGYPDGLAGDEIPLGARIVAVADTFDAITSTRAYRPAGAQKQALDTLSAEAGTQLDAAAVAAFLKCYSARRSVVLFAFAAAVPSRMLDGLSALTSVGTGAGPIASFLPAVGAAGALALSGGAYRTSHFDQDPAGPAALVSLPAQLASSPTSETGPSTGTGGGSGAANEHGGRGRHRAAREAPGRSPDGAAGSGSPVSSGASGTNPGASGTVGAGGPPATGSPGAPAPTAPVGKAPSLPSPPSSPAPPVTTPSAGTPTISTPTVTTPSVSVGGVTTPTVTVPSVTVPSVTLAPVRVPGH